MYFLVRNSEFGCPAESCQLYMGLRSALGPSLCKVSHSSILGGLCKHSDGAMSSFPHVSPYASSERILPCLIGRAPEVSKGLVDPFAVNITSSLHFSGKEDHAEMEGRWRGVLAVLVLLAGLTGRWSGWVVCLQTSEAGWEAG